MTQQFDLGIIGGGPAGYTAAFQARTKGLSVVMFEKDKIGGVCLNSLREELSKSVLTEKFMSVQELLLQQAQSRVTLRGFDLTMNLFFHQTTF